ncbi:MAG: Smr/MutS family protein [bacterium]
MAGRKHDLDQDEIDLFRQAMTGVTRREYGDGDGERGDEERGDAATKTTTKITPKTTRKMTRGSNRSNASTKSGVMIDQTDGDTLAFCRGGIQRTTFKRLKRGSPAHAAILDLHGHTTNEASRMLPEFLAAARANDAQTALIIHGKGLRSGEAGAVLKQYTANWLKQNPTIKAFCSAQPSDGGTGAVYVLL